MLLTLEMDGTHAVLSDEAYARGLQRLVVQDGGAPCEIPFLLPALAGHHFFTGEWPRPRQAVDYEPHESPGTLEQVSPHAAVWHQPATPYARVETRIAYEIVGPGTVEARFETRSHATAYPHGYVGLFWGTVLPHGGQRGWHVLVPASRGSVRWRYFAGGGDCWSCRANTLLGPHLPSARHDAGHPPAYYLAEAAGRFALPIQVVRWQDLYYSVEVDTPDVAFTNVLLATAIGGPSHDLYWRLGSGERRAATCRLTVGPWPGWQQVEARYRAWTGCVDPAFRVQRARRVTPLDYAPGPSQSAAASRPGSGLALSRRLFETRGRPLLARLGLLDRCAVACVGSTSQNAGLDDSLSRDHWWGPHLTFLLFEEEWAAHHTRLQAEVEATPDEVDGISWRGYSGPRPRKTAVKQVVPYLRELTGFEARPRTDREWLPHLTRAGFLGRRWTEQLFDAGQGEVFHDPEKRFTELWRHWTGYVPPDIHRALLARSLFRVWNAGPEYNLARAQARGDGAAFALCLGRFVDEVIELTFCVNERFIPAFKWRPAHFRRLPLAPDSLRAGIDSIWHDSDPAQQLDIAGSIVRAVKSLVTDLYHVQGASTTLSGYARAIHATIEDPEVRRRTPLDW